VPEDVDAQVGWRLVRAKLLARRGDVAEAETLARDALARASSTDYLDLRALALADLGAVLRIAGHRDEAEAGIREAVALYEQKGNAAAAGRVRSIASDRTLEV
jgi:Flp pilus assembly protein TadD